MLKSACGVGASDTRVRRRSLGMATSRAVTRGANPSHGSYMAKACRVPPFKPFPTETLPSLCVDGFKPLMEDQGVDLLNTGGVLTWNDDFVIAGAFGFATVFA
jgi:hypothetical protein